MACSRTEPKVKSAPAMERGDHGVLLSHGQRGHPDMPGTRRRQLICRITKPTAKTLLTESGCRQREARPDVVAGIVYSADQLSAAR
jgi:hypothetical protein